MQSIHLTAHWRPTRVSDLKGTNLVRVTLYSWKMTAKWPTHKTRKSGGRENTENFNAWNGCPSHTYTIKVAIIISLFCLVFFYSIFPFAPPWCSGLDRARKQDLYLMKKKRISNFCWLPNRMEFHIGKIVFDNPIQVLTALLLDSLSCL